MTPVKNQGSCGSCWAFSAVQEIESGYAMANKVDPISFSPQQFVDCVKEPSFGSEGCNGGWMDDVFDYALKNKLCTEQEYEYTGRDGKCHDNDCKIKSGVTGRYNVPEGDMNALYQAAEKMPLAIAIDATPMSFYKSGVLHIKTKNLNHGVQLVGYDIEAADPFLLIRNSWGARWGFDGYVKVSTVNNGGADLAASYPEFGDKVLLSGLTKCNSGEKPDAAINCLCTYGENCDKKKPKGENGCKDDCGCGEFGYCR
jgi:cathepsin L/xylem cysteine proteinase